MLLAQDEDGLKEYVYDKLKTGDAWWIPDALSQFGTRDRHPWIVITDYSPKRPPVLACPRTSQVENRTRGILMPANILPGLEREGIILLSFRRSFAAHRFRDFEYIGGLPDVWIQRIREGAKRTTGSTR